jgi:zinc transport system substrate-binding protein
MVPRIAAAVAALLPQRAVEVERRRDALVAEMEQLTAETRASFAGMEGRRFYVFHPAWGYFAREYGLEQVAIEDEGKEPDPSRLARVIGQARRDGAKVIFVQPQFSRRSAELVAEEIGARLVVLDPLASDWLPNLRRVAQEIRAGLV